jgi:hypothetical protein
MEQLEKFYEINLRPIFLKILFLHLLFSWYITNDR